ncbi:hypothetical protein B0H16DRAFT_270813 [Mycena metata]|uniref:Uncharacterized protein n=1 Tax=Mycena metata TaxID=1033252 RepID=A0AAD7HS64_9AGAR|nr:hypothetical protein B0H16DRAFT_270813 [Mycena metata]
MPPNRRLLQLFADLMALAKFSQTRANLMPSFFPHPLRAQFSTDSLETRCIRERFNGATKPIRSSVPITNSKIRAYSAAAAILSSTSQPFFSLNSRWINLKLGSSEREYITHVSRIHSFHQHPGPILSLGRSQGAPMSRMVQCTSRMVQFYPLNINVYGIWVSFEPVFEV